MKTNWSNVIKDSLSQVGENLKLTQECQYLNQGFADAINRYKNETTHWYDEKGTKENPFSSVTQNLWYQHYLNKKRLNSRKIGIHYEYIRPTSFPKEENQRLPFFSYAHDGKHMLCTVKDSVSYKKVWYRNRQILWVEEPKNKEGHYYLMQSKSPAGGYICPNCANPGTLESLTDGCDYCGTKFHLEDFQEKVSCFYLPETPTQTKNRNPINYIVIPLFFFMMGLFIMNVLQARGISLLSGWIILIIGLLLIAAVMEIINLKNGASRTTVTKHNLRQTDPFFSEEYFVGNLTNKLASIHYAGHPEEVSPFALCDFSNYIEACQDVVECRLTSYLLKDFFTDESWQHLKVQTTLTLKRDIDQQIRAERRKLNLHLIRDKNLFTSASNSAIVYTCKGCGASISLLNGGKCQYCGKQLQLQHYDWVILEYDCK